MINFEDVTHLFTLNWVEIERQVEKLNTTLPRQGVEDFGGWSVQGKNGSYKEGWFDGAAYIERNADGTRKFDEDAAAAAGYSPNEEHVQITRASCPAINSYLRQMSKLGFKPMRSRLIDLRPGDRSNWHTDSAVDVLTLRMHAVIRTNPAAVFITENETRHLTARRVYLINVNDYHQVKNLGDTSRTHLVTDVIDSKFVSKVHHANL